jgi:uncharacterized protein
VRVSANAAQPVDPAVIHVWRIRGAIWAGIAVLAYTLLALSVMSPAWHAHVSVWISAGLVLAGALLAFAWAWPRARYRRLSYRIDDVGVVITSGVLWRSETLLPRVRIQHTDVTQGPLERRFGIATLKMYTAGSRFTETELPGLAHGDALALRDALLADRVPA